MRLSRSILIPALGIMVMAGVAFAQGRESWLTRTHLSMKLVDLKGDKTLVEEITLPPDEKFVGITGYANQATPRMLTTRQMKAGEQPEIYKIYNSHDAHYSTSGNSLGLILVIKEWRQ